MCEATKMMESDDCDQIGQEQANPLHVKDIQISTENVGRLQQMHYLQKYRQPAIMKRNLDQVCQDTESSITRSRNELQ